EILTGCSKDVKIERKVLDIDGSEHLEYKVLCVQVNPGVSRIEILGEGHQYRYGVYSNIYVVIRDTPHQVFKRDGADIIYTAAITAEESQNGCSLSVPTLDS